MNVIIVGKLNINNNIIQDSAIINRIVATGNRKRSFILFVILMIVIFDHAYIVK